MFSCSARPRLGIVAATELFYAIVDALSTVEGRAPGTAWPAATPSRFLPAGRPLDVGTEGFGMAFSPDGRRIASASNDKTVRVWNADGSGNPVVLAGHIEMVNGVAFGPGGSRIASVSADKTVRVWNADGSGDPIVLTGHTGTVDGVAFSPDGNSIASASADKTVRVWRDLKPVEPGDPRRWSSTSHCLSVARRKEFLAISEESARTLHERCLRRTAQTGLPAVSGH